MFPHKNENSIISVNTIIKMDADVLNERDTTQAFKRMPRHVACSLRIVEENDDTLNTLQLCCEGTLQCLTVQADSTQTMAVIIL